MATTEKIEVFASIITPNALVEKEPLVYSAMFAFALQQTPPVVSVLCEPAVPLAGSPCSPIIGANDWADV